MLKRIGFYPDEVGGGQWRPGWTHSLVPSAQFSFFQMGTVCTEANFSPYGEVGDGDIGKSDD